MHAPLIINKVSINNRKLFINVIVAFLFYAALGSIAGIILPCLICIIIPICIVCCCVGSSGSNSNYRSSASGGEIIGVIVRKSAESV